MSTPAPACYVDPAVWPYRGMLMCHLFAEDTDTLHAMAARLGLKRQWFQDKPGFPHYDICKAKRDQAVRLGAIEVTARELVAIKRRVFPEEVRHA